MTEANERFGEMLDDLEAITPAGEDGELVTEWLADWRTYLEDRAAYVEALRSDPEAQLLVTAKDREQITEFIDAFAAGQPHARLRHPDRRLEPSSSSSAANARCDHADGARRRRPRRPAGPRGTHCARRRTRGW